MKKYPLFKVHVQTEKALSNIREVFESGFINEGTQVTELTNELSTVLATNHLVLTNAGTSALTLALHLAGVGNNPDDEVITTPMTCVATNTPIVNSRAKIVWADVDPETGLIDVKDVVSKITSRTRAIMAVAWAGTPPELPRLYNVCRHHGIKLILDAAHAFGATFSSRPIHDYSDYTCYSFQAIKHFTTGDGGALVCLSADDYVRSKNLKWFGLDRDRAKDDKGNWKGQQWDVDIVEAGYKFNMNNVSAAIGLSQIDRIAYIVDDHRYHAKLYSSYFDSNHVSHVKPLAVPIGAASSYWVYPMRAIDVDRDDLIARLNAEGIMAGLVHVPNDAYTAFARYKSDLPGVAEFARTQFNLPCGWWLFNDDIAHIASRVEKLCR